MAYLHPGASGAISGPGRRGGIGNDKGPDMSQYMEEFHKSVHNIPSELVRQLKLIKHLDEKVSDLKETIAADCAQFIAAKSRDTEEMQALKAKIEANKKECLDTADEKVTLVVNLFTQVEAKLSELDARMAVFDEAMLQQEQQQQAEEAEDEPEPPRRGGGGGGGGGGGQGRADKRRKTMSGAGVAGGLDPELLVVGAKLEALWQGEWWDVTVKKVETRGGGGGFGGGGRGGVVTRVLIGYEGGDENEDEWIDLKSGRLQAPQGGPKIPTDGGGYGAYGGVGGGVFGGGGGRYSRV